MGYQILVAFDGSDESARAIEYGCEIGSGLDASITVAYAVQPDIYEAASGEVQSNFADAYRREILRTIDAAEEQGQEYLAEAEEIAEAAGWDISTELLYGDPVNKLLEFGGATDVNTIVVGHQGQTARSDGSIGSVAKALIERASVPVTVAR